VKTSPASCLLSTGGKSAIKGSLHIVQGPACRYNATLTFTSSNSTATIGLATMSQNKQVIEGVGSTGISPTVGTGVTFNMIKIN
jgi:hypothetical protein